LAEARRGAGAPVLDTKGAALADRAFFFAAAAAAAAAATAASFAAASFAAASSLFLLAAAAALCSSCCAPAAIPFANASALSMRPLAFSRVRARTYMLARVRTSSLGSSCLRVWAALDKLVAKVASEGKVRTEALRARRALRART
jgi:hypothetical protein